MASFAAVFNHLVLPPKIPGKQDEDLESINKAVLRRLIHATTTLDKLAGQEQALVWSKLRVTLRTCEFLHGLGRLEKHSLMSEFRHLEPNKPLVLYITEQNAGLLIRRDLGDTHDTVIFEAFETSAPSSDVLACERALIWDFPDCAAQIPMEDFQDPSFQHALADFLEKGSVEALRKFQTFTTKAQTTIVESRGTTSPALVTHLLIPLIEAIGSSTTISRSRKRVRDDVNFQAAKFPWRRLPFWLVLRVGARRHLDLSLGLEHGRACYKFLMVTILVELLQECPSQVPPELTMILRAKICRRLAKLEQERRASSGVYSHLFAVAGSFFKENIERVSNVVNLAWEKFKRETTRPIPRLPLRADQQSLYLSLPNSGQYLQRILDLPRGQRNAPSSWDLPPLQDTMIQQVEQFTNTYCELAKLENDVAAYRFPQLSDDSISELHCIMLAEAISSLFITVGDAYASNPEQMSIFILSLFILWVRLDKKILQICPLLGEYRPVFSPELLDALHLPTVQQMEELRDIQLYLHMRCQKCKQKGTIFAEPDEHSFTTRYVAQSAKMQKCFHRVQQASDAAREAKKIELEAWQEEYDAHSLAIAGGTCVCTFNPDGSRNVKGCTKCFRWRRRNKMEIEAHEDYLPADPVKAAAVIFELSMPEFIAAYRNTTWQILRMSYPDEPSSTSPPTMLNDQKHLKEYASTNLNNITLASTSKSFRGTHYKVAKRKMRASEDDVLFPNGLNFCYFDTISTAWIQSFDKPLTFQHLCGIYVPKALRDSVMPATRHPPAEVNGPSSYEIVASETKCPPSMSVNEFTTYQRLLSGKARRWPTMLVELGASDLNFSSEMTMRMFSHLALQAGPAKHEDSFFRDVHVALKDPSFCDRLAEQVGIRLNNIRTNWREVHSMEILITISLRLLVLGPSNTTGHHLLKEARNTTLRWITRLRTDVRNAKTASVAETAANYSFWAALLCRRTFTPFIESNDLIPENDLNIFVQASLALQESLLTDLSKLPSLLKSMLIRDTKSVYAMQPLILRSINASPGSIGDAINACWSDTGSAIRKAFGAWQLVSSSHDRWVVTTMTTMTHMSANYQVVHYNFLEGHLLIDCQPLGRLPREIRESSEVAQLFGDQHLLTYPSGEVGMSYMMATQVHDHFIHFGMRDGKVIIRAHGKDGLLEYIPSNIFAGSNSVDLPFGLVSGCVHWLNLEKNCIEIRREAVAWRTRRSDWMIDLGNRQARRKNSYLVDPNSPIFNTIANIFRHFEDARRITVFQPIGYKGRLSVELRHLELSFAVNDQGLLECGELREEIDPNQDVGTWYGLNSKIVLRGVADKNRRSIIVPAGKVFTKRRGMHVAVLAANSTVYMRFGIDDVLGRLSCPAEPRLLYAKAQFHAFTSFVLPDPLTGRTGTDEALQILQSAYCQPWTPLGDGPIETLKALEALSPRRSYYPKDKKAIQSVDWNPELTMTIQHDAYENLVRIILRKSERLRVFAQNQNKALQADYSNLTKLRTRGILQRCLYETSGIGILQGTGSDVVYQSKGRQANSVHATNVYHITRLLRVEPFKLHINRELSSILQEWPLIGGFHASTDCSFPSLSDLIEKRVDEQWGSLIDVCRKSDTQQLSSLMFRLCLMSLNSNIDMNLIYVLAAFASLTELKNLQTPSAPAYSCFKLRETPTLQSILRIIAVDLPEKPKRKAEKAQEAHRKACEEEAKRLSQHFLDQWPDNELTLDGFDSSMIDIGLALERVVPEWRRLHNNTELSDFVIETQEVIKLHQGPQDTSVPNAWNLASEPPYTSKHDSVIPSISIDLGAKSISSLKFDPLEETVHMNRPISLSTGRSLSQAPTSETNTLRKIISSFVSSTNTLRKQYGRDLEMSLNALESNCIQSTARYATPDVTIFSRGIEDIRALMKDHFFQIRNAVSTDDARFQWLDLGNLWPCNTSLGMLELLRSSSSHLLSPEMKESIISHGILITDLQRLLRIRNALYQNKETRLQDELRNYGHQNWSPYEFPEWLLLEIDSDIMIRPEQIDVAHAIIAPRSGENTVLQLNMGKGKTSCIVPMAMAILGNGEQLARLIVPKALLLPTAQMIQSRLGGLVGREIRHLPFSRRTDSKPETLQLYQQLHQEMLCQRGVILNAPEHVLSFKLSGLQHLANSDLTTAQQMIDFQSWLDVTCRDVLDESDVSLAVKTQLIYPSGNQITVDAHPQRWQVPQALLSLVLDHLPHLRQRFPRSIEIIERGQGYPMILFLQTDVEEQLHELIIKDICIGRTTFLRLKKSVSVSESADIRNIILNTSLDDKLLERVAGFFVDKKIAFKNLLLIRGLISNRILLVCLKKRWNVQYGLHPDRDPIAVPFEAKSVPSEQAEFGHPDVAIILTCLAFYYSGLSQQQFSEGLRQILSSHDPSSEYDRWISACSTLPESLSHWNVINVDDQDQIEELWKHLRFNRTVLDQYMNRFVFPAHAKQFGIKLQASGWDLPLFTKQESGIDTSSEPRTTGFSGTNDNKTMLPLTIRQDDLPTLHQTNAEVLTYLLQDRNRGYYIASRPRKRSSEEALLEQLRDKEIHILIDAGAYILEMDNETLAKKWLDIDHNMQAAIFFGTDNRAMVRYRGTKDPVPLLATSFVDNLDNCLVYFDEAHTRGVDLKLPQYARGALTLALGQTKDHTVQAAMRLRQLATTQSVRFFAFPGTHQSILDVCKLDDRAKVDSTHVVRWLLEQTCCANEQFQNLYISQGLDFCNRVNAEWENVDFISDSGARDALVKVLQRPEQQTLEQLYGNGFSDINSLTSLQTTFPQIQGFIDELSEKRRIAASETNVLQSSVLDEVEQEREVEFQVEEVREIQKPVHHKPLKFPGLHPAISDFISTGVLSGEEGYEHVFAAIARTSLAQKFAVCASKSRLFVSTQFMRTVKLGKNGSVDNFQRPVEWVLYSPKHATALVLIAEEAELLIPILRAQKTYAKVHLLTYSAPVTKKMVAFSALRYYALPTLPTGHAVPHWLTIELGILAGRLYMGFDECAPLIEYIENMEGNATEQPALGKNPVGFLLEWFSLRRRGQDITHTPMGYICQGRTLDPGHAFFVAHGAESNRVAQTNRTNGQIEELNESEEVNESEWSDADQYDMA